MFVSHQGVLASLLPMYQQIKPPGFKQGERGQRWPWGGKREGRAAVRQDFTAADVNRLRPTDTEHPTGEGKLYLCTIKDA